MGATRVYAYALYVYAYIRRKESAVQQRDVPRRLEQQIERPAPSSHDESAQPLPRLREKSIAP
jgi:hypothetical protein